MLFKGCDFFYPLPDADGKRNCASCINWGGDACKEEDTLRILYDIS